ncbi:MAG: hypothetical protein ABL959_22790, partial [Pyrinomonadaceae bacterium]
INKDCIYAGIGVFSASMQTVNVVTSYDPRCADGKQFYRNSFETRHAAINAFNDNVATSHDRGWTVVYNGERNFG